MKTLKAIDQALARVEGWLVILLLTVMMLLAFTQVVLRNGWNSGLIWGDIVLRHLVLWIGFLGAALAASQNRHINVDALTRFLSARVKGLFSILTNLFASVVCFLLFRAGMTFIEFEIADRHEVYAQIPSWYVQVIIPAGFLLIAIHFLIRAAVSVEETVKARGAA
jgi:TRAP-type C4-dicarboxylate transport system permease small subunit